MESQELLQPIVGIHISQATYDAIKEEIEEKHHIEPNTLIEKINTAIRETVDVAVMKVLKEVQA